MMKKKAIFLDRDGVINKEKNYVSKIEDFDFIDGVFEVCQEFQREGFLIIIITNQSGIARGLYSEQAFDKLMAWVKAEFLKNGVEISGVYLCPHHPDFTGACECRKPKPGMITRAKDDFDIDLRQSILIGDKNSDIGAGKNAGVGKNYLISTGHQIQENAYNVKILGNLRDLITI